MSGRYKVAERFKSVQGEGVYAGTPMAFIRFVGCSVGKKVCQHCDTDFDTPLPWRGGGEYTVNELLGWAGNYKTLCLTGGEPLNQDLEELVTQARQTGFRVHIETSGTVPVPLYMTDSFGYADGGYWICVSPKPGYLLNVVRKASEIKVIVPGLGTDESLITLQTKARNLAPSEMYERETFRWPTLEDALQWAWDGSIVFLQPRNGKFDVDKQNLLYVQDIIRDHPELRLSIQLHKLLKVQ